MQILRSAAILGCLSLATANEVVSLVIPNVDNMQNIVGKVIGTEASQTTYVLKCAPGTDSSDCGFPASGMTVAAGDDTFEVSYTFEDYLLYESCKYRSTTWISCYISNTQSDFKMVTETAISTKLYYLPVTVTATDLTAAQPAATPTTGASASQTASSDSSPTTGSTTTSAAQATETPNAASNGLLLAMDAKVQWVIGGLGTFLALALA